MTLIADESATDYEQRKADKSPSPQKHRSTLLLVEHKNEAELIAFEQELSKEAGVDVCPIPGVPLRKALILHRKKIAPLLKRFDKDRENDGRAQRNPDEVEDQWRISQDYLPALLAVGIFVEGLWKKGQADDGPHLWLNEPPKQVGDGDENAAKQCLAAFHAWLDDPAAPRASRSRTNEPKVEETSMSVAAQLKKHKNVIVEGVAGSGKTHLLQQLKKEYPGRVAVLVFHPSTSYEDFVIGLRPAGESFKVVPGAFLMMCERAYRDPDHDYLLFIDEINRANTARVLGDLMMVIESSKRTAVTAVLEAQNETPHWEWQPEHFQCVLKDEDLLSRTDVTSVQLQTPLSDVRKHLVVPENLHILGTMNTTDRSVGTIDLALRRRFWWVTSTVLTGDALKQALDNVGITDDEILQVVRWHEDANKALREKIGSDAQLGHSYFFTQGASASDIAEMLLHQLAEVAHTFNIRAEVIDDIAGAGTPLPGGSYLNQQGTGLGRRFIIMRNGA